MGRGLCYNQWGIPTPDEVILAEIAKSFNYDRVLKNELAKRQSSIYSKLLYMYGKKILEFSFLHFFFNSQFHCDLGNRSGNDTAECFRSRV